jgi:aminopeptidase N
VKEPMFIPVAVGLVDSSGNDMPLTSVYSDGTIQTLSSDGQPVFTTVLQFKKVKGSLIVFLVDLSSVMNTIYSMFCG